MAPVPTYQAPHKQLGELMVKARRRGLSFEAFWQEAVRPGQPLVMTNNRKPPEGAVRWPTDYDDRGTWLAAIYEAKEGWRRAYEREEPTPAEKAITVLCEALGLGQDRKLDMAA